MMQMELEEGDDMRMESVGMTRHMLAPDEAHHNKETTCHRLALLLQYLSSTTVVVVTRRQNKGKAKGRILTSISTTNNCINNSKALVSSS